MKKDIIYTLRNTFVYKLQKNQEIFIVYLWQVCPFFKG